MRELNRQRISGQWSPSPLLQSGGGRRGGCKWYYKTRAIPSGSLLLDLDCVDTPIHAHDSCIRSALKFIPKRLDHPVDPLIQKPLRSGLSGHPFKVTHSLFRNQGRQHCLAARNRLQVMSSQQNLLSHSRGTFKFHPPTAPRSTIPFSPLTEVGRSYRRLIGVGHENCYDGLPTNTGRQLEPMSSSATRHPEPRQVVS